MHKLSIFHLDGDNFERFYHEANRVPVLGQTKGKEGIGIALAKDIERLRVKMQKIGIGGQSLVTVLVRAVS